MSKFHVLIPAAGTGSRMGAEYPKQYLPLLGRPLIHHTLSLFASAGRISSVHVVISPDDAFWEQHEGGVDGKVHVHREGGDTRAATVLNGLQAMAGQVAAEDWILVHDAARPGLSHAMLDRLLDNLQDDDVGGLLAIPLADTLKRADAAQRVAQTEPRDGLWQAQTPQMFRYQLLKQALQQAGGAPTDEAQAVEALGFSPKLVPGELRNLKITYPQDLKLVEAILLADAREHKTS
ncbi:2-C-methyl-D-erythritol 4-phosphate cytidylyltransferase [Methylobacillus rhizosphaerae]|uniref:2-C-methyl-D-erythritol 4-phosphate cytidylyltransferase n=1 Tax=Methylobacillus rhizosphaerae TaxID=551994 RepID=A0A238YUS5_9PROT|nr:2-C-methyl-D-erythritol 4-phosphate cytidylyltransferase [Methylobacillus rhizosphaerae]SNR74548.1 2-C-methyl-D-erythritol 4-phosphate cytidylyltransferase [Methylobacillus rhizosphaerae]